MCLIIITILFTIHQVIIQTKTILKKTYIWIGFDGYLIQKQAISCSLSSSLSLCLFEGRFHSFVQRCSILSCKVSYVLWTDRRCSREWHWQIKEEGEVRSVTNPYGDSRSPDGISGHYHQLHFSNYHTQYQSIFCKIKPIFLFSFLQNHSLSGKLNSVRIDYMFYNHVTFLHAYRVGSEVIFLGYL